MTDTEIPNPKKELRNECDVFTTKEAAAYLRTSPITLWRERRAGRIAFRRVSSKIVYLRQDLENYLESNKREAFGINATT